MKKKLWLLPLSMLASVTFAASPSPEFDLRSPGQLVYKVKDIRGDGFIAIENYSILKTNYSSDDLTVTCDNEVPFVVSQNMTRYCFDAIHKVTITLQKDNFRFGSRGEIGRRVVG